MPTTNKMLKKMWRMYTSITFGLIVLSIIAGVCIFGTMYYAANSSLGDNAIPLAKDRVFSAWWFFALLAFFFVQFVISTWRVTIMSLMIWWKTDFSRTSDQLSRSLSYSKIKSEGPESIVNSLSKKFTRVHMQGNKIFAHKGIASRLGPTIIHAGIVLILLAGMVRIILNWQGMIISEGRFSGVEGETRSTFFAPKDLGRIINDNNIQDFDIGYDIKIHDFDEIKFANSQTPAYYSSLVEVINREDKSSRFMKLDMNHSMTVNGLQFHQASFVAIPEDQGYRVNFDVRYADSGERLAVTDASVGTRVQIDQSDYYLEVDGELPGADWRIFKLNAKKKSIDLVDQGKLLPSSETVGIRVKALEFFPDFVLNTVEGEDAPVPSSQSNVPKNPALMLELYQGEQAMAKTMIFMDQELNKMMPQSNPYFSFQFDDIQTPKGTAETEADFADFDWTNPSSARFILTATDLESEELLQFPLVMQTMSETLEPSGLGAALLGPQNGMFAVYPQGRTTQYATVFTVVREPLTHYNTIGVGLIFIGAMMTFVSRYRALHGIWNPESKEFEFAIIPRFGKPDMDEVQQIIGILQKPESNKTPSTIKPVTT